jgi:hypothetical protein
MTPGVFWLYAVVYQFAGGVLPPPNMPPCLQKLHPTELCIRKPLKIA